MNLYEQVERLLTDGALVEAKAILDGLLDRDAQDALALTLLGALHALRGRFDDAIDVLERATAIDARGYGALFLLGQALYKVGRPAASVFVEAADAAPSEKHRIRALLGAARCLVDRGRPGEALSLFVEAGLLPAGAASSDLNSPDVFDDAQIASIPDAGVSALLYAMYGAGNYAGVRRLGLALADRNGNLRTNAVLAEVVPVSLLRLGLKDEAAKLHLRIVAAGGRATDFRPSWRSAQLARLDPALAQELYRRDVLAFGAFPERKCFRRSEPATETRAHTLPAAVAGRGGVVFRAEVASCAVGAEYRIEYGRDPTMLVDATPWRKMPAPLGGPVRESAYRALAWRPQSTQFAWVASGPPTDRAAARLTAPFATDRNHLSGIGACDLVMGLAQPGRGGVDLRDAEVSFTLRGDGLADGGACLTLWAARDSADVHGDFCSQWALTGDVIPSEALQSQSWTRVCLNLSGDPEQWTYVGNNRIEQGDRANRYRPLPLGETLSCSNHPFVLLFALGQERSPPAGSIEIFDFELRCRVSSVLSAAAGAVLAEAPSTGIPEQDANVLTDGSRGCDASLWTSAPRPEYPLVFRWTLPRPVRLTALRIDQHPYCPAKEVEFWVAQTEGSERLLWRGTLPEGRPDRLETTVVEEAVPADFDAAAVTLRILSGYREDRCGLDGIHVSGDGAQFAGDGRICNISEEVPNLAPGELHYRVTVREGNRLVSGKPLQLDLPATRAPVLEWARPWVRGAHKEAYLVRANAMGLETELWGELHTGRGAIIRAPRMSLGSERTGRHIIYFLAGLPEEAGVLTLHARNAEGDVTMELPWPLSPAT